MERWMDSVETNVNDPELSGPVIDQYIEMSEVEVIQRYKEVITLEQLVTECSFLQTFPRMHNAQFFLHP